MQVASRLLKIVPSLFTKCNFASRTLIPQTTSNAYYKVYAVQSNTNANGRFRSSNMMWGMGRLIFKRRAMTIMQHRAPD